ncbi:MAG: hypothetical protein QM765_10120 [Myxococcales bacterium]
MRSLLALSILLALGALGCRAQPSGFDAQHLSLAAPVASAPRRAWNPVATNALRTSTFPACGCDLLCEAPRRCVLIEVPERCRAPMEHHFFNGSYRWCLTTHERDTLDRDYEVQLSDLQGSGPAIPSAALLQALCALQADCDGQDRSLCPQGCPAGQCCFGWGGHPSAYRCMRPCYHAGHCPSGQICDCEVGVNGLPAGSSITGGCTADYLDVY